MSDPSKFFELKPGFFLTKEELERLALAVANSLRGEAHPSELHAPDETPELEFPRTFPEFLRYNKELEEKFRAKIQESQHAELLKKYFHDYPAYSSYQKVKAWYEKHGFGRYVSSALARAREFLDPIILLKISEEDFREFGLSHKLNTGSWTKVEGFRLQHKDLVLLLKK